MPVNKGHVFGAPGTWVVEASVFEFDILGKPAYK
jgi:hypothetical protein